MVAFALTVALLAVARGQGEAAFIFTAGLALVHVLWRLGRLPGGDAALLIALLGLFPSLRFLVLAAAVVAAVVLPRLAWRYRHDLVEAARTGVAAGPWAALTSSARRCRPRPNPNRWHGCSRWPASRPPSGCEEDDDARDPRAQSAVEALLGTILFVTLIFGGLELARAVSLKQALDRGAFEGARYLATHGNVAGTTPVVQAAVGRAILGADPGQASVSTTWTPVTSYGDSVCVTATYATTIDMPLVAAVARTLSATHCTPYEIYP